MLLLLCAPSCRCCLALQMARSSIALLLVALAMCAATANARDILEAASCPKLTSGALNAYNKATGASNRLECFETSK